MTDKELLELTRRTWEPRYGRPLSDQELEEIIQNMSAFLRLLSEWNQDESNNPS